MSNAFTIEDMIARNVYCNVTALVSALADGGNHSSSTTSATDHLLRQAARLAEPTVNDDQVYEFWAVSDALAERLIGVNQRVDTSFGGLNVWARTTTGQAIKMDDCIERIFGAGMRVR